MNNKNLNDGTWPSAMTWEQRMESDYKSHSIEDADGWEIAEWSDGICMVLSPRTCPRELGQDHMMSCLIEAEDAAAVLIAECD